MMFTKEILYAAMATHEEVKQVLELQLENMLKDKDIICKEDMLRVMDLVNINTRMIS